MMSVGVPLGAKSPTQADQRRPGSPISAKVGMSGSAGAEANAINLQVLHDTLDVVAGLGERDPLNPV